MAEAVRESQEELGSDFFDHRPPNRAIAVGPLPFLVKTQAAIRENFGRGLAGAGTKKAGRVHVVVAHVQPALRIADRDQCAELDSSSLISCPYASAVLPVMKTSVRITGAVGRIGGTDEHAVIEAD